jgi:hypothetical protein
MVVILAAYKYLRSKDFKQRYNNHEVTLRTFIDTLETDTL